ARRIMRQGVSGIFLKQGPLTELTESIRVVANGGTWLDRGFAAREYDLPHSGLSRSDLSQSALSSRGAALPASPPVFNERQRKALRFVLEGLSNKEIAWRLQISESYVKAILQSLFQKTGVRTRGQLVRVAFEQYEDQL